MKRKYTLSMQVSSLVIGIVLTNTVLARFDPVLNESFERFDPASPSNSGHKVNEECGGSFDGNDYQDQFPAEARLMSIQVGNMTAVKITLRNGGPYTLYTVWVRVKGIDQDGNAFGGNPLTNGGATPLAPGHVLDELERISPWNNLGSAILANGFMTDGEGRGTFIVRLDFPLHGGSYPFNKISNTSLENIRNLQNPSATAIPRAIVNLRDTNIDGPFTIRIVSHCQDGLGHGLVPANRETWFDWPPK